MVLSHRASAALFLLGVALAISLGAAAFSLAGEGSGLALVAGGGGRGGPRRGWEKPQPALRARPRGRQCPGVFRTAPKDGGVAALPRHVPMITLRSGS